MKQITEDYVSYETSKLLKEKGFNWSCEFQYINCSSGHPYLTDRRDDAGCYYKNSEIGQDEYSAPTHQMAMKWLREVHGIFITIEIKCDPRLESFIYYQWSVAKYSGCQIERIDNGLHTPEDYWLVEEDEKYEYATEEGIKYCLENLI